MRRVALRSFRAIDWASLVCAAMAAVLLIMPPGATSDAGARKTVGRVVEPPPRVTTSQPGREQIDGQAARIVRGNLFSSSRRTPATRFTPATLASDGGQPALADPLADAARPAPAQRDGEGAPHLFGVVLSDGVRQALVVLRDGEPPRLLAVGDRHAGYRVTAIENDRVVLAHAGGVRTLRLTRPALRDSSRNLP